MSFNTFGKLFRFTTWGESHGPAIGCIVDGCPPNINLKEQDIQIELDKKNQDNLNLQLREKRMTKFKYCQEYLREKLQEHPFHL